MAVISSFDQWKKDVFFSAAEEVQESADTMESVYIMWIRERGDGLESEISDELMRELHTCIGTAKWQLEEFERAVGLNHENYPQEENIITRHRAFIAAIRSQICCIEKTMNNSLLAEGKQPLRWVQLDEDERGEFETFLSSAPSPKPLPEFKDKFVDCESIRGLGAATKLSSKNNDVKMVQEENSNVQRRTRDSPEWKIEIADEEDTQKKLAAARRETHNRSSSLCGFLRGVESTARLKWFRNSLWMAKRGEHIQSRQGSFSYHRLKGINPFAQGINGSSERGNEDTKGTNTHQTTGRFGGLQRNLHGSQSVVQFGRSLRITLLLVLTIFLIVPFVLYSS